jgi:IS5 family transposase
MGIARGVVRQAEAAVAWARAHEQTTLPPTIELVKQIVAQTRARELRGNSHFPGKIVSRFESHTEIIRNGNLAKPTEFGRVVKIQEAEGQFITDYEVCDRGQAERALWVPALDRHIALFARPPHLAVADGGFASRKQRARGAGAGRPARRAAAPAARAALARGARRPAVAYRQRGTHQRTQTPSRTPAMPLPRPQWHAAVGRAGGARQ